MKKLNSALILALGLAAVSCGQKGDNQNLTASGLNPDNFVAEYNGKQTALYRLTNGTGAEVCVTNFGGRIVSIAVPDRDGELRDVVLGFDSIQAYFPENNKSDFGAAIGRYANRIAGGRFVLDGDTVQLPQNNFGHCLHGGPTGWQYQVYDLVAANDSSVTFAIDSPDGDNNFPGNVHATVTYTFKHDNTLDIAYSATTDKPTIINMTNHSYFNLGGDPSVAVTGDSLFINSNAYTPVDSTFMTTGEIAPVEGTPMDFSVYRCIGQDIDNFAFGQLKNGNGYDHNWVLNTAGDDSAVACRVYSPASGIIMEVFTNEPGVQFYSGNFLDGSVTGKKGIVYNQRAGLCLETQHYPDSPNKPQWHSVRLNPGETYTSHCAYRFTTDKK